MTQIARWSGKRTRRASSTAACFRHIPAIETLEARRVPATLLPDIVLVSASTPDSKSVIVNYRIDNTNVNQNFNIEVDRSAENQLDSSAVLLGALTVVAPGSKQGPATLDLNGRPAADQGAHELEIALPAGLPIDPKQPDVLVVADPTNVVAESNKANNTATFQTHVIGIVTHGGIQPKNWITGPPWEHKMAETLKADGYDAVIPFNWVYDSHHPGAAARQGPRLAAAILNAASKFPASDPVDLHFIGHSEGTIVNSEALVRLDQQLPANLRSGYIEMTMLDPHAANTGVRGQQYSVSNGLLGWIAKMSIDNFQSRAKDPFPFVPANVNNAEVFYQHTPVSKTEGSNNGMYNLWGQVPVLGSAHYFNLTATGISHSGKFGVQDWYEDNIAPTLGNGDTFANAQAITGSEVVTGQATGPPTYAGSAAPGVTVTLDALRAGSSSVLQLGRTVAGPDGSWTITTRPLPVGRYEVVARARSPIGPRGRRLSMVPTAWMAPLVVTPQNSQ